jgi:hypothetical protein
MRIAKPGLVSFSSYLFLFLLIAAIGKDMSAADKPVIDGACSATVLNAPEIQVDDSTDVNAAKDYEAAVGSLLATEKFSALECFAHVARTSKSRMSGGMWKIHMLYFGLAQPQGHATEEDWQTHLDRLKRWMAARPDSVTPTIALADAYIAYADEARGGDTADTVTDSGWRLFGDRLAQAQQMVDKAALSPIKDPELLLAQIGIAWSQAWEPKQMAALVKSAAKFEPGYYYYYRIYSAYLQPKWYGDEGATAQFAAQMADQIGGDDGNIAYFQIAVSQICHCGDDEVELKSLSWPRIQKGFAAQEKRAGSSLYNLNQVTFMATVFDDLLFADQQFQRLGDHWSDEVWHTQSFYQQSKRSAAEIAPTLAANRATADEAAANLKTADGVRYQAEVEQAMATMVKECAETDSSDLNKFTLTLRIGTSGKLEKMTVSPATRLFNCVVKKMWEAEKADKPRMPQAPKPEFWVRLDVDPQSVVAAQGK